MRGHHVFLQHRDRHLLEEALRVLPCRKRSQVREDRLVEPQRMDKDIDKSSLQVEVPDTNSSTHDDIKDSPEGGTNNGSDEAEPGSNDAIESRCIEVVAT